MIYHHVFNDDDVKIGLSDAATKIINRIRETGLWPVQYKTEWGVPIPKQAPIETESQLRIISCTNQVSKAMEKVVVGWLMKYVKLFLDPDQMGGQKGHSISHYRLEVANFILYNKDLKIPHATVAILVDYAQGLTDVNIL